MFAITPLATADYSKTTIYYSDRYCEVVDSTVTECSGTIPGIANCVQTDVGAYSRDYTDCSSLGCNSATGLCNVCTPNWSCTEWSACDATYSNTCSNSASGTQTRTCTDSNNCGTTSGRPALSQSCSITRNTDGVVCNTVYGNWGACSDSYADVCDTSYSGTRSRSVTTYSCNNGVCPTTGGTTSSESEACSGSRSTAGTACTYDCSALSTTCRTYNNVAGTCSNGACSGTCNSYTNAQDGTSCTSQDTSGTCQSGICIIPTPTPVVPTCWSSTQPSDSFSISNGCTGTITSIAWDETSIAWDESTTGDMTYDSSIETFPSLYQRTTRSDDPAGVCNTENVVFLTKFIDSTRDPNPGVNKLTITSALEKKCGTDTHSYGYSLSTNCKILNAVFECGGGSTCPIDPNLNNKPSSTTLKQTVPDNSGLLSNCNSDANQNYFTYTFTIGECLSNSDCSSPTPFCDVNDKRCKGTTPSPRSPESPADGATTSRTPTLDVNSVTDANSYHFYVRSSGQTPATALYKHCSPIDLDRILVGDNLQLDTTYYWSAKACTDNNCNTCGNYAPEWSFKVGNCDVNNIDVPPAGVGTEDRSSQCSSPPVGQEGRLGRCDLVVVPYTCQYPTCRVRNQCATDYCCGTELPNAQVDYPNLFGQCASKSIRTPNNKFLCTT